MYLCQKKNDEHAVNNLQELIKRYSSGNYTVHNIKYRVGELLLSLNRN